MYDDFMSAFAGMGMDPALMQFLASNPEQAAQILGASGVPPPPAGRPPGMMNLGMSGAQPGYAPGGMPPPPPTDNPFGAAFGAGGPPPGPGAAPQAPGGGGMSFPQMLAYAGRVPMSADTKPMMSGGVTRPQDAPQMKMQQGQSAGSVEALLKMLLGPRQNPLFVPPLGNLFKSGGIA